jgi:hypothetical protein
LLADGCHLGATDLSGQRLARMASLTEFVRQVHPQVKTVEAEPMLQ